MNCLLADLADARSNSELDDGMWAAIWESAESIIKSRDLPQATPVRRQQRASALSDNRCLRDFVTTATTGR
jgi:hypothetical protein